MDALLNTTEAAARCGVTTRQFRSWRLKWPNTCEPRDCNGRLEFYDEGDVDALIAKRKERRKWSGRS